MDVPAALEGRSSDDSERSDGTAVESTVQALQETKAAAGLSLAWIQGWVQRRGRLTQLFIGGIVAVFIEMGFDAVVSILEAIPLEVFVFAPGQLLAVLIGVITQQAVLQGSVQISRSAGGLQPTDRIRWAGVPRTK